MFGLEKVATKLIIGGVISLVIASTIFFMKMKIDTLEAEKKALESENTILVAINKSNLKTINALEKNEQVKDKLVSDLKIQIGRDKVNINVLREQLDKIKTEDNGPVSKVLRDTVIGIQTLRDTRTDKDNKEK